MKTIRWYVLFTAAVVLTAVSLYGLWTGYQDIVNPPKRTITEAATERPKAEGDIYVALGDSLTRGVGSDSGSGYVQPVGSALAEQNIRTQNLAISGSRTEGLLEQLEQPEVQRTIRAAKVITITIGGNDLFNRGENVENFKDVKIEDVLNGAQKNLDKTFQKIRSLNPDARIVYLALYNPFKDGENGKAFDQLILNWNSQTRVLATGYDIDVVDTFNYVQKPERDLSADQFHPNDATYEKFAEEVLYVLRDVL